MIGFLGIPDATAFRLAKILFLAAFGLASLLFLVAPRPPRGQTAYGFLRFLLLLSFAGVLAYQATWQLGGASDRSFARFLRRYNNRPNAAQLQTRRAPILDRNGLILSAPVPGSVWQRRYPLGPAAVHPVGYFSSAYGMTGVERAADPELSGYDADLSETAIDRAHNIFKPRAEEGRAVTLTLDSRLQLKAYQLLAGRRGAVVILKPDTGDILALASSPAFDPSDPAPATADTVNLPAFNRATQGRYPPGSTYKILLAGWAISHAIEPAFDCPASGYSPSRGTPPVRDSEYYAYLRRGATWPGWGRMSLHDALVHSSNTYFAQLGVRCGPEAFGEISRSALLSTQLTYYACGDATLATVSASAPTVTTRPPLATLSIGQGQLLVTPLHVALWTAAAASDGSIPRPRLRLDMPPAKLGQLFRPAVAARLRRILRDVVRQGTGRAANVPGLEICGKTGTAQVAGGEDHAWFTSFAPERRPRIVVTVLIENGGFGAAAALPVARELIRYADTLDYLYGWSKR